jgi:uncharacterized membrane protein YgcG
LSKDVSHTGTKGGLNGVEVREQTCASHHLSVFNVTVLLRPHSEPSPKQDCHFNIVQRLQRGVTDGVVGHDGTNDALRATRFGSVQENEVKVIENGSSFSTPPFPFSRSPMSTPKKKTSGRYGKDESLKAYKTVMQTHPDFFKAVEDEFKKTFRLTAMRKEATADLIVWARGFQYVVPTWEETKEDVAKSKKEPAEDKSKKEPADNKHDKSKKRTKKTKKDTKKETKKRKVEKEEVVEAVPDADEADDAGTQGSDSDDSSSSGSGSSGGGGGGAAGSGAGAAGTDEADN